MSAREYGLSVGYEPGQTITGPELAAFQRQYEEYRKQAVAGWEMSKDNEGNLVRVNPHTGLVMTMTNQAGQPVKAADANPFAGYMGPGGGAGGVAGAAVDTNSAAFQGVQPTAVPAAAPQGNAVAPVNVNPAVPAGQQGAGSMGQGVQTNAAPMFRSEDEVIAAARTGQLSKAQAQQILVNQFGLDP